MPGREPGASIEASESPVLGTLKAHKVLPRPKLDGFDASSGRRQRRSQSPYRQSGLTTYNTSERIKSWIPEPSAVRVLPVVGPPLTPPLNFRDNFKSWINDAALRTNDYPSKPTDSGLSTPLTQQTPPTPETTPPKPVSNILARAPAPSSRNVSDSRTQSFKTANENFSSEDENQASESPSVGVHRQKWVRATGLAIDKTVGLGLGLESEEEDDEPTPRRMTPELDAKNNEFVTFGGVWGGDTAERIHDQLQQRTQRHLQRNPRETPLIRASRSSQPSTPDIEESPGFKRNLSLPERVGLGHDSPTSASTENFADQIDWPLKNGTRDFGAEIREFNEKRSSQASTSSTVVAAMVLDSPPRRRQTLRHTGRIIDSNASSIPQPHLSGSPPVLSHHSLRRRDRNTGIPEDCLRSSFMGERSDGVAVGRQRNDLLNVIPDRRSSLHSSTSSTKRLSKTFSVTSRQQSSRPTTAPEEAKSYFDIPLRDRRTVSVVIQQARPLKPEDNVDEDLASPPATQVSDLSAPPISSLSRTTSVTSGGMIAQHLPADPPNQRHGAVSSPDTQESHHPSSDPAVTGDWSAFRPRSALVTPFSLRSAHSSTPGTLEVNEAIALSIHPHTNKSILVIQEIASKDDSKPREQSTIVAGNASIAIPGALTPLIHRPSPPRQTDSPLQNPRDPPRPPEFIKIIPPTPANATSSSEDTRIGRNAPARPNRISAPFSIIKDAMSTRRLSETFRSPLARNLSLRIPGAHRRYSFAEVDERETRLHPSWRPRRYFDGTNESDSDSEFGNDSILFSQQSRGQGRPTRSMSLTNRIAGSLRSTSLRRPQRASSVSAVRRSTTEPLAFEVVDDVMKRSHPLTRRLTGSLRLSRARRPLRSTTAVWSNQPHYEFVNSDINGNTNKHSPSMVPGQGFQVHFVGFRGLVDKLERRREFKAETRREARRDWLRSRIGYAGPQTDEEKSGKVFK